MTTSTSDWEKKWKLMIDKDNNKKIQNELLNKKLRERKDLEESIECTFHPKLLKNYGSGYTAKRSKEDLIRLLFPIISEEESILIELKKIDLDEDFNKQELRNLIASTIYKFPSQRTGNFSDFYRDERLKDISNTKNLKLEIVGKLQELERKFNILCSSESLNHSDLKRVGFDIENCKNIKSEILKSIDNHDTLKNRFKVSSEFEEILKDIDNKKDYKSFYNNNTNEYYKQDDSPYSHTSSPQINNNQQLNYNQQLISKQPNFHQAYNNPPAMCNLNHQGAGYDQPNNQSLTGFQMNHNHPHYNQFNTKQLRLSGSHNPYPSSGLQLNPNFQPNHNSYRFNNFASHASPSSNSFMGNFKGSNRNLNDFRPFTKSEYTNPFLVNKQILKTI